MPGFNARCEGELVTPTAAALLAACVTGWTEWPAMRGSRVGYGAGTRDRKDRANLVRLVLGTSTRDS